MTEEIDREAALYSFRSFTTLRLQEIVDAPISAGTMARELAQTVLDERKAGHPYILEDEQS